MLLCGGLLAMGLLAGCGDDDPAAPAATNVSGEMAEEWSTSALEMVTVMVAEVPTIATGDMGQMGTQKVFGEPTWDATQMAWVFEQEMTFNEGDPPTGSTTMAVSGWVQYRNGDGPLPSALGATEMEYRLTESIDMHSEEGGAVSDLTYVMATEMVVTYEEAGYLVNGSGDAEVHVSYVAGDQSERADLAMSWGMDMALPMAGCPAGTATVEVANYRLQALYDGQGGVSWSMAGPGYQANGTDVVECNAPM
jgi:hypothetical protein